MRLGCGERTEMLMEAGLRSPERGAAEAMIGINKKLHLGA
jgi:hypothetical protein